MKRARIAGMTALVLSACRSYSPAALQELYATELAWAGYEEKPSLWPGIEEKKFLTLADAYRIALTRSERIARAAEGFLQSLTLQDRNLAAFLPTVSVQATQFLQNDVPVIVGSSLFTTSANRRELKFTYSQPLFHGLREFAAWRLADETVAQRKSFFETERRLLFQLVAQTFYNTLFLERQVGLLDNALKNTRDRLREMQARQAQGISRKTEVLLIETQVASDEAQLYRAKQALDVSLAQFAFLVGRNVAWPLRDDSPDPTVPSELAPLLTEALGLRSDLKEREAAVRASEENVTVIQGEHFPSIDLTGNYYLYRENYSSFQQDTHWDLLFTMTFNVFKGGDIRARIVEAESQWRVAQLNRDELRRQIEVDVTSAFLTLRSDEDLIRTLQTRERTARENYAQVENEYRQGIAGVSNLEVLVAQNQLLSAALELERQRIQRKLDGFQLETAQGKIPVR